MMKSIKGIQFISGEKYSIFIINEFTNDIKKLLKNQLSSICHGKSSAESDMTMYNYQRTLQSFLKRYEDKSPATQKGMIGELLSHIIISNYFNYEIASPFFNKEENSIKKGFDIILYSKDENSLWLTEVKSGELLDKKNSNQTTLALIAKAKTDLKNRINQKENDTLWINAVNDAKIAFENYGDSKEAVKQILERYDTNTSTKSSIVNAFLVSVLFASLTDKIDKHAIENKSKDIIEDEKFKDIFILSLQKATYDKVYQFLKEEANDENKINPKKLKKNPISV